jgi:hypothetical protein
MNGNCIELREMPSGEIRDYLDGSRIYSGAQLLMWATGQWVVARYEIADAEHHEVILYGGDGQAFALDRGVMRFRWPA